MRHLAWIVVPFEQDPHGSAEATAESFLEGLPEGAYVHDIMLHQGVPPLGVYCKSCGRGKDTVLPSGRCQDCEDREAD